MNRTRLIFFVILATCAVILLASFAGQARSETLLQIYLACTVFGGGVVALDFLGLLGGQHSGGTGHDFGTFTDHGAAGAHDFGAGHAAPGGDGHGSLASGEHMAPGAGHTAAGHDAAAVGNNHDVHEGEHAGQVAARPSPVHEPNAAPILSVLAYLRLFVYFCLGFGPIGLLALWAGEGMRSLLFAVPAGVISYFLARAFFRFQRQDTGAVAPETDLLGERATVVVPLSYATMGKVRVQAGMAVTDMYALAADEDKTFERGAEVRIVRVTDDCVRVR